MARRNANEAWICVSTLIHGDKVFHANQTYRASETEVIRREQPDSFIRWPATPGEIRAANAKVMARALEPQPEPEPEPVKRVRATRNATIHDPIDPNGVPRPGSIVMIVEGDLLPAADPLVRGRPELFEPVR